MNETEGFSPDPASEQIATPELTWDYLVTENARLTNDRELTESQIRHLTNAKDLWYSRFSDLSQKVTSLEDYIDTNWNDLDEETRDFLCELFDFNTEVTKDVSVSVTYNLSVTAPRGFDWSDLNVEVSDDVTITNSEVTLDSCYADVEDIDVD